MDFRYKGIVLKGDNVVNKNDAYLLSIVEQVHVTPLEFATVNYLYVGTYFNYHSGNKEIEYEIILETEANHYTPCKDCQTNVPPPAEGRAPCQI